VDKASDVNVSNVDYYQVVGIAANGKDMCRDEDDYKPLLTQIEKSLLFSDDSVRIVAYCLESENFSILVGQDRSDCCGVAKMLHSITTGYNKVFFDKYLEEGVLSENAYSITNVNADELRQATKRFHTCHNNWINYSHSSLRAYLYDEAPVWLDKSPILSVYQSTAKYFEYLSD
jgi:hypothetical protein